MPIIEPKVIPEDYYSFSLKDLDRFIIAIERRIASNEVMHTKDAAKYLGISASKLYKSRTIPFHNVDGIKLYLRSELIDFIKKH